MVDKNQHMFYFPVFIGEELVGEGSGSSKPKGRKQAALAALKKLGLES